jgi:hypothetical protein
MRTAALTTALVVTLLSVAAGEASRPASGLFGVVKRGPIHPVCMANVPCDEPAAHATLLFSRRGVTVRVKTDARGRYRVRLRPGRYAVRKPDRRLGSVDPAQVRVPAGRYARVNIFIDTGIR